MSYLRIRASAASTKGHVREVLSIVTVSGAVGGAIALWSSTRSVEEIWLAVLWVAWVASILWTITRRPLSLAFSGLLGLMLLYVVLPATIAVATGRAVIAGIDYTAGAVQALQLSCLAQVWLLLGAAAVRAAGRQTPRFVRVGVRLSPQLLERLAAGSLVVAFVALILLIVESGADPGKFVALTPESSYGEFDRSASVATSGYLVSMMGAAGVTLILIVVRFAQRQSDGLKVSAVLLISATLLLAASGQRQRLLVPMIAAGLMWWKTKRGAQLDPPGSWAVAVVGITAIVALSAVIGVARSPGERQLSADNLWSVQFGEGSDLFSPLAGLAASVPAATGFLHGASYLDAIVIVVPRALWPDKPTASITDLTATFADVRNGIAFPEFGEFYANFGVLGVGLGSAAFGAAIEYTWLRFAATRELHKSLWLAVLTAGLLQVFTRGYAVGQLAGLLGLLIATGVSARRVHGATDRDATDPVSSPEKDLTNRLVERTEDAG